MNVKNIGGFGVDSVFLFNNITSKINKLKNVENFISSNIKVNDKRINDIIIFAKILSNLLHETQKERCNCWLSRK